MQVFEPETRRGQGNSHGMLFAFLNTAASESDPEGPLDSFQNSSQDCSDQDWNHQRHGHIEPVG